MSSKNQRKSFELTPAVVVRVLVFSTIITVAIWHLSLQNVQPSVLGRQSTLDLLNQLYQEMPVDKRQQIEKLPSAPVFIAIQEKFQYIQDQLNGFPAKQIEEAKKAIIKSIARDLLKNLE